MSAVTAVLLVVVLIVTAAAVYAIYRYGFIPAVRALGRNELFRQMWHTGGRVYRCSLFGIVLGLLFAVAGGVLLAAGLVWQGGLAFVIGMTIVVVSNYVRFRAIREHGGSRV